MGGEVVRPQARPRHRKTVYSNDPCRLRQKMGGRRAPTGCTSWTSTPPSAGSPKTSSTSRAICAAVNIPCELGGGMRNLENVSAAFSAGISRVILGTKACESMEYVEGNVRGIRRRAHRGRHRRQGRPGGGERLDAKPPQRKATEPCSWTRRRRGLEPSFTQISPPTACWSGPIYPGHAQNCSISSTATSSPVAVFPVWRICEKAGCHGGLVRGHYRKSPV